MKQSKNNHTYLFLFIIIVILLIVMISLKSSNSYTISLADRIFFAIVFISSCLFGISIAIHPNYLKNFFRYKNNKKDMITRKKSKKLQGHHPDCNNFKNHIIITRNKTRCAGCLGLILGAIISILLMTFFLFFYPIKSINILYYMFILGLIIIIIIFLEIKLKKRQVIIHIFSNTILIIAFFCITLSVFEITEKTIYGLFAIIFCFFWLDTRIQLSHQQHSKICESCIENCKTF